MNKILFATNNKFKLNEARHILNIPVEPINIDIEEIQDIEVDHIVQYKAWEAYKQVKQPVFVEDTGLYFNALNGFPGALIKWLMVTIGTNGSLEKGSRNDNIIKLLSEFNDKSIFAKTSIGFAYSDSIDEVAIISGVIEGKVPSQCRGRDGFGWDDIFIPEGYDKTFAELGLEEKNKVSMRKQALTRLDNFLICKS
jgi:XTP/dITP diphosphohydrolase